ncbi:transcriptional repressor [Geomonas anaerohicana]|uniref:transcriptional repressor n=1 Tax=Geomonas anaerohicana TaxID=2798583 RepID=UPI002E2D5635|nr:transcriptional repressor [Geomonas anaerohicana]
MAGGRRHDYQVCSDCGTVTEFENSSIERYQAELARSMGFTVQSLKIELRGGCNRCTGPGWLTLSSNLESSKY